MGCFGVMVITVFSIQVHGDRTMQPACRFTRGLATSKTGRYPPILHNLSHKL